MAEESFGPTVPMSPLPPALRSKGLTAMRGYLQTVLSMLEELAQNPTSDEFKSAFRRANPELKSEGSLNAHIYTLRREFDLCRREGDRYVLTPRGVALRASRDPDVLADHLLANIFGVDHVLRRLSEEPAAKAEIIELLKRANPGWTSNFAPTSMMAWLDSLSVAKLDADLKYRLTERGQRWARAIVWRPEVLEAPPQPPAAAPAPATPRASATGGVAATAPAAFDPTSPEVAQRLAALRSGPLRFDASLISRLHAGLWSHPVRHFAILTGLSGSGKTQLALRYARALCGVDDDDLLRTRVVSVQPGWYDPSPLLGYPHPIQDEIYRSAPFLELLLRARDDPGRPYVAILDEMNLSHPEQYLAPVLSAMETRGWMELHSFGDDLEEIPMQVPYPPNLALIGTLNMDETTHGLSDKVLDRAFTLEFWDVAIDDFPGWEASPLPAADTQRVRAVLKALGVALAPVRLHFGWRTIDDVLRYLAFQRVLGLPPEQALDDIVYAKILPKLRGEASTRFEQALGEVHAIVATEGLARCAAKVRSLSSDLQETGSARFWR